jgi:hypothetical protein
MVLTSRLTLLAFVDELRFVIAHQLPVNVPKWCPSLLEDPAGQDHHQYFSREQSQDRE